MPLNGEKRDLARRPGDQERWSKGIEGYPGRGEDAEEVGVDVDCVEEGADGDVAGERVGVFGRGVNCFFFGFWRFGLFSSDARGHFFTL